MKLEKNAEDAIIAALKTIFANDLWDYEHSISSANWMKKLVKREGGNEKVLVTAMYLHDSGYPETLRPNYTLEDRISSKPMHPIFGAKQAKKLLPALNYTQDEIKQICHLIIIHDELDQEKNFDEQLVLEADTLAQIDPSVSGGFDENNFAKYVTIFEEKRFPKVKTSTGKELLREVAHSNPLFQKYTKKLKK